jgi:hypothetical protein
MMNDWTRTGNYQRVWVPKPGVRRGLKIVAISILTLIGMVQANVSNARCCLLRGNGAFGTARIALEACSNKKSILSRLGEAYDPPIQRSKLETLMNKWMSKVVRPNANRARKAQLYTLGVSGSVENPMSNRG